MFFLFRSKPLFSLSPYYANYVCTSSKYLKKVVFWIFIVLFKTTNSNKILRTRDFYLKDSFELLPDTKNVHKKVHTLFFRRV